MTQQPDRQLDPSIPNAARMQAIGDLLARGIRRLDGHPRQTLGFKTPAQIIGQIVAMTG